ncbi:MAG: hypothetical protein ACR2QU_03435 [Gammaproteobacteria bacterium]
MLSWQPPKSFLDPAEAEAAGTGDGIWQRIDVTVYKQGFDKDLYATTSVSRRDSDKDMTRIETREFERAYASDPEMQKRAFENVGQTMDLSVADLDPVKDKADPFAVHVEGLTGGVNYYWRVLSSTNEGWVSSEVIRCQAQVCPVDEADAEATLIK